MSMTVERLLEIADDSVLLINDVNTKGASSNYLPQGLSQSEVNKAIQRNVDHLETILEYTDPDVKGSSDDKTSYTTAITTGKTYITDNS